MSVTILKQPAKVDLSGNYLPLWLSSDREIIIPGKKFETEITFTDKPDTVNRFITMTWADGQEDHQIWFRQTPIFTTKYILLFGSDVTSWIDQFLIPGLNAIYELYRDFVFERSTFNTIKMTARHEGAKYNVTFQHNTDVISTSNIPFEGKDTIRYVNFGISALLEYKALPATEFISHSYFQEVVNSGIRLDLSEILFYSHTKVLPDVGMSAIKDLSEMVLQYRVRFAEAHSDPLTYERMSDTQYKYALPGGRSVKDIRLNGDFYNKMVTEVSSPVSTYYISKFLTWHTTRKISFTEPLYLYYMAMAKNSTISHMLKIFYKDGTFDFIEEESIPAIQYGLYCLPSGFDVVDPHIDSNKEFSHYQVFVYDQSDHLISDVVTVHLDQKKNVDEIFLLYRNSFGVHEVFRATGLMAHLSEFEKTLGTLHIEFPQTSTQRASIHTQAWYRDSIDIHTQFLTREEMDLFREVLNSTDFYWLNSELTPVTLESGTLARFDSKSGRRNNHTFTVKLDPERFYSHA